MKLSHKLAVGLLSLSAITIALGSVAVVKMRGVVAGATALSEKYVPEVNLANQLSDAVAQARLNIRTYSLNSDEKALASTRQQLAELSGKVLPGFEALLTKHADMTMLAEQMGVLSTAYRDFSLTIDETEKASKAVDGIRAAMTSSASSVVTLLDKLQDDQNQTLAKEIDAGATGEKLQDRREKIADLAALRDEISEARVANFKAQALRDRATLEAAVAKVDAATLAAKSLAERFSQPQHQKMALDIANASSNYAQAIRDLQAAENANAETASRRNAAGVALETSAGTISKTGLDRTTTISSETRASLTEASTIVLVGLGIATVIGIALSVIMTRSITKPINRIVTVLSASSDQTASASTQVSASSQSLAQGASEQAASLEETGSAINEMASMVKKNAETGQQANALSEEAKRASCAGTEAMTRMNTAILDIERSSQETAKIIKTIDEIAFQTNLLALNAAVEAARAGEAGKGFAVVAEEVRNLAMRSAEAAKNTSSLIEESVGKAKNGVTIAQTVATSLSQINDAATRVSGLIAEIAAAGKEQATGIDQISQAVGQMDKVTQTNAANAEETAAASEELNAQAEQLQGCVRDLQKLVGLTQTQSHSAPAAPHRAATSLRTPKNAAKSSGSESQRLIPLESAPEGDFTEFSKAA